MRNQWVNALALTGVVVLVLSACGQSAPPTATAAKPTPTQGVLAPPTFAPTPVASPQQIAPVIQAALGYPPERVKELVAQGFYLAGMQYARGQEPQYGGVAILSNRGEPPGLDPTVTGTTTLVAMTQSITGRRGTLVRAKLSNSFEAEGYMAKSWETTDNFTLWTFKLRQDVKWHDGVGVTADDIKFYVDLVNNPPAGRLKAVQGAYGNIKEAQVIDPYTIRLVMKSPTPHLLDPMMDNGGYMSHPKHLAEPILKAGNPLVGFPDFNFVSVGPHKFASYAKGSGLKVVRNPIYFEKDAKGQTLPYLDGINFHIVTDPTVAVSALRAGKLDGTSRGGGHQLSPDMIAGIKKSLGDKVWYSRGPSLLKGPMMQAMVPPFNDINLRRAVSLYADRQEGIKTVWGGLAEVSGLGWPGSPWANPDVSTWPGYAASTKAADRAEAKRLLQLSGLAGTKVEISAYQFYLPDMEFIDQQLRGLGLDPYINVQDDNLSGETGRSGKFQVKVGGGNSAQPSATFAAWVTTNPLNSNKHGDTKVDDYAREFNEALDPLVRRKIWYEAERYILQEKVYYAAFYREVFVVGYRTYFKGVWVPGTDTDETQFDEAWIDKSMR